MAFQYVSQYVQEELSESDCPSEGQHLTELYRRKHAARSRYYHVPGYYEHQSRPCPCSYAVPPEPARCYYYRNAAAPSSRSSTRLSPPPPPPRTCHDTKSTTTAAGKKYPVTARTPRYYRCPVAPLCKRPSTLCLPVTCQPDPAAAAATAVQRVRKPEVQRYVKGQEDCEYKTKEHQRPAVDSEGDVNSRLNDLENLLTKFDEDGDDEEAVELSSVKDLSKILKPKVPPSMKEKIVRLKAVKPPETPKTLSQPINELQVKEVPADEPLDLLLQHLSKENEEEEVKKTTREEEKKGQERKMASFPEPRTRRFVSGHLASKPSPLDDNSALELHKSKSYIVSLIDKALSRELGTIPGDKCSRKEFLNMSPKKAVDLVNRHAMVPKTCNRLVSVDVAQASSVRKDGNLECRNEEPLYLKQLKQLRWSHLRHIQREAKRLADLERFLDSFGEIDSGP